MVKCSLQVQGFRSRQGVINFVWIDAPHSVTIGILLIVPLSEDTSQSQVYDSSKSSIHFTYHTLNPIHISNISHHKKG